MKYSALGNLVASINGMKAPRPVSLDIFVLRLIQIQVAVLDPAVLACSLGWS
jgi:hypothetical protein